MFRIAAASLAALLCAALVSPAFAQDKKKDASALRAKAQSAVNASDFESGIAACRALLELDPDDGQAWFLLGYCLHGAKKLDEALKAHEKAAEFPQYAPTATYNVACVYALRNDKDKAFEWLKKAVDAGFTNADHIETDADMDSLRGDPRFAKIVAAMTAAPEQVRAFAIATPRSSARLFLFGNRRSAGQVMIDHGQPDWKDAYGEMIDSPDSVGKRWRLGSDFWTTLDSNLDLTIGGTKVPAGVYYLALEHKGDSKIALVLLDPVAVRKEKIDAFQVERTAGSGTEIVLQHREVEDEAEKLAFSFESDPADASSAKLIIRFGPHELTAPVRLQLEK
jgi:tetratricopeptide (TPR) repeat protein